MNKFAEHIKKYMGKKASKCASRKDWEFPNWETETIEDKIEWLYTHNKNYNNTQYDNIWKLRETLKGSFVDYDEKGEKVYLNKEDIEDILYYLKHHNKNYHGDQYWIIDSLKVEDFLGKLKQATKCANATKNADKIQDRQFKEIYLNLIDHKTPLKDYRTLLDNMSYEERMAYYKWLKDNNHAIDEMEMVNFLRTLDNTHGINANKKAKTNKLANIIGREINKSAKVNKNSQIIRVVISNEASLEDGTYTSSFTTSAAIKAPKIWLTQ